VRTEYGYSRRHTFEKQAWSGTERVIEVMGEKIGGWYTTITPVFEARASSQTSVVRLREGRHKVDGMLSGNDSLTRRLTKLVVWWDDATVTLSGRNGMHSL
jgi:hypothetical protein